MANTTPKISLRLWDQLNDPYSHDQLSDNWSKVDFHDHTPGRGLQIPTEGIADGAITPVKAAASLDPSSAFTSWKFIRNVGGSLPGSTGINNYALGETSTLAAGYPSAVPLTQALMYQWLDPADFAVPGRTVKYRLQVSCIVNATAPAANFSVNLFPAASTSGGLITNGSAVAGMSLTFTAPAINTMQTITGPEVTAPAAAMYVVGVTNSAITVAGSVVTFRAALQMRQL